MSKPIIGIYHSYQGYSCIDGIGAAWAFAKYMKENGKEYRLIPGIYGHTFDGRTLKDSEVYFLDFTVERKEMLRLSKIAKKITIIDHHESAEKDLQSLPETTSNIKVHFDVENSGAVLAWRHFFPEEKEGLLLRYIEDADLNKHEMEYSEEITLFFRTLTMLTPEDFDKAYHSFNQDIVTEDYIEPDHRWIRIGAAIRQYQKFLIDSISDRAMDTLIDGNKVAKVNCEPTLFVSVGNHILKNTDHDLVWLWAEVKNNSGSTVIQNSLRSNGDVDCQDIAKKFNGGGHINGAGFIIKEEDKKKAKEKYKDAVEKTKDKFKTELSNIKKTIIDLEKELE